MFRKFTKKRLLVLASVTALALAGIAFAFFSSTGTGGGTGSVANPAAGSITLTGTVTSALVPGGNSSVTFKAANGTSSALHVDKVHLVSVTADTTPPHNTCDTSSSV